MRTRTLLALFLWLAAPGRSPALHRGRLVIVNDNEDRAELLALDEFALLRTNKLADDDLCMATPALVGDRLLIRTAVRLYCLRPKEPTKP